MGKVYDDWFRLVEAVLRREKLRQLCFAQSVSSSGSSSRHGGGGSSTSFLHLQTRMAIVRLQEELIYTLTQNNQCFEYEYLSLPTPEKDEELTILVNTSPRQSSTSASEEHRVLDLLDPDTIPQIKAIAAVMFASSNNHEFCEAFVRFWKGAFAVCLTFLDVEEVGFEDVVRMEWEYLSSRIKKWCSAIKKFVTIYLANAKLLFDQVLGEYGDESSSCLMEASKPSLMLFSSFACAVVIRPHQPESLFCLLDMYEDLVSLIPSIENLFPCEIRFSIGVELNKLVTRLQDYASISMELGKAIRPSPNCGIHPLTKDVLNYILSHGDYEHADLIWILKDENEEDSDEEQSFSDAVAVHVHSIASALEANIAKRSELHDNLALKHIFMMNNIHYMFEMIRNSEMKSYFGGEWLKSQVKKFQFHGLSYERSTWGSILPLLRYDLRARKATLEARCRKFTAALEKVYEEQRDWRVPNLELRQELRILASTNVVRAYLDFFIKARHPIGEEHVKYTEHDVEAFIFDLFEGSPSMPTSNKHIKYMIEYTYLKMHNGVQLCMLE